MLSSEFNFDDDMFADDRAMRPKKSREEKRKDRYGWACLKRLQDDIPNVDITNSELRKLQDEMPSIQKLSLSGFWSMMPCLIICGPHDNSQWKLWNSWFYRNSSTRLCTNWLTLFHWQIIWAGTR